MAYVGVNSRSSLKVQGQRDLCMPKFGYKITGTATIYSDQPIEPIPSCEMASESPISPSLSYHAKKTVAFAQECAIAFAKDCSDWTKRVQSNQLRTKDSNITCDFNSDTKQYFVHGTIELHAPLTDVLDLFAPSEPDSDPFFSRVFDTGIDVSLVAQHVGNEVDGHSDWQTPSNQASSAPKWTSSTIIKRVRFHDKAWKKELLCLEHFEPLTPTSVVRFYESVDGWTDADGRRSSSVDSWTQDRERHQNLTFGFLFEKISRANRLRLSFLGYHTTTAARYGGDETCKLLEKVGSSLNLLKKVVLRRRLTIEMPVKVTPRAISAVSRVFGSLDPTTTLPRACHICAKSFHLFRKAHFCQICQAAVCSKCTQQEETESSNGLVVQVQVCKKCHKNLQEKSNPPSNRRRTSHRGRSQSHNIQTSTNYSNETAPDDDADFQARRQAHGAAMIPPFRSPNTATPKAPRTPKTPKTMFCSGCMMTNSTGQCGACSQPFCSACSVMQRVKVGSLNVFDLQLCHPCVAQTMEPVSSTPPHSMVEPIFLRPSYNPEAEEMMRTMTLAQPFDSAAQRQQSWRQQAVPLLEMEETAETEEDEDDGPTVVITYGDNQIALTDTSMDDENGDKNQDAGSLEHQLQMFACLDLGANHLHDALCADACTELECANAYVTLIYQGSHVLKGAHGATAPTQILSTCALVKEILQQYQVNKKTILLVVPDASADPRFASSPRVTSTEQIRFFCGMALVTGDGHYLGTVAVADTSPRLRVSQQHRRALEIFHDRVLELIEDRLALALENE